MTVQKVPLADVINLITENLRDASSQLQEHEAPVMQFNECEIEFGIEVEKDINAKTNVWVIQLGGGVRKTDTNTIRIKFSRPTGDGMGFHAGVDGIGPALGPDVED